MTPHPYADFLHLVEKPARYTGGELGEKKRDWSEVQARICLAFPDVYDIGMSHLGYKILYAILNRDPRTLAERTYAPWIDMERELRARGLPLVSHESARPLRDFDVVGLSLQYELTFTNCLTILDLGGIPLRARDRGEAAPLVLGGGPVATHPEPVAPFFDAFVIGDGEDALRDVALLWVTLREAGVPRPERLRRLTEVPGVYVPSLYETGVVDEAGFSVVTRAAGGAPWPVRRTYLPDISKYPFPDDSPVGGPEAIFDRMSIEVARGCTEGCRFCQAGMIYRPVRERSADEIVETVVSAVKKSGYDEASLTSLSMADMSCITPLVKRVSERLAQDRVSLSVSSLRAYGLPDELLEELRRVRAGGLTFAPEAGTQRMRDVINKNVTEAQLVDTAERVFRRGWDRVKLYFMMGLPTETDEDVVGIADTGRRVLDAGRRALTQVGRRDLRRTSVTVSVSTYVPKPHTPFQWAAMDTAPEIQRKHALLRARAREAGVDLKTHTSEESVLEGVFARGDRPLADVIETAYANGARFDSWKECLQLDVWRAAFAEHGVDTERYLGTIPVTARLPWDHLDVGLEEGFLASEYRKALRSRLSPPCGKAVGMATHHTNVAEAISDKRRLVCYDCGIACDMTQMRERRVVELRALGAESPATAEERPAAKTCGPKAPSAGPVHKVRVAYEKLGPMAYLGHLDFARAVQRVFRRTGLPLAYSGGFSPKPLMVFGPALSLGVPALADLFDVGLHLDVPEPELLARLDDCSSPGLRFTAARRLVAGEPPVTKRIGRAVYALVFARHALPEGALEAGLARFASDAPLVLDRTIGRVTKTIDVRAYLDGLVAGAPEATAATERAGLVGDLVAVRAEARVTDAGAVKPSEIVTAVFGDVACRPIRVCLLDAEGRSPLLLPHGAPTRTPDEQLVSLA